jgi:hypothetical protein
MAFKSRSTEPLRRANTQPRSIPTRPRPYKWKRPSAGWMIAATFGYAHWNTDGDLALGWINEMVEQEACSS